MELAIGDLLADRCGAPSRQRSENEGLRPPDFLAGSVAAAAAAAVPQHDSVCGDKPFGDGPVLPVIFVRSLARFKHFKKNSERRGYASRVVY